MLMRRTMTVLTVMAAAATVVGGGLVAGPVAWASTGHVHPGSVVTVSSNTCEVGFLLRQRHTVYASVPASCLGTDGGGGGSGCMESQSPNGTPATIAGASRKAHLVYSSFTRMQERGTTSAHTCAGNNLALLQLSSRDARRARRLLLPRGFHRQLRRRIGAAGQRRAAAGRQQGDAEAKT